MKLDFRFHPFLVRLFISAYLIRSIGGKGRFFGDSTLRGLEFINPCIAKIKVFVKMHLDEKGKGGSGVESRTGQFIARRRKAIGLTQKELADRLGVTNKAVSKWETGMIILKEDGSVWCAGTLYDGDGNVIREYSGFEQVMEHAVFVSAGRRTMGWCKPMVHYGCGEITRVSSAG